jgi:hypothetical protein
VQGWFWFLLHNSILDKKYNLELGKKLKMTNKNINLELKIQPRVVLHASCPNNNSMLNNKYFRSGLRTIEWSYLVQCNLLIPLRSVISGLPPQRKIVCAVVTLPSAKPSLHTILYLTKIPPPPPVLFLTTLIHHHRPLPLVTTVPETLPETSVIVLPP